VKAVVHRVDPLSVVKRRLFGTLPGMRPPFASLAWQTLDDPRLPGPAWARLEPQLAGICGSDLAAFRGRSHPLMAAMTSFPSVPGHEVVARVVEAGEESGVHVGETVVVDPAVSCFVRGVPPCPRCTQGQTALCERVASTDGNFAPGLMLGYHRDLPGGFAEAMLAHASQLHRPPARSDGHAWSPRVLVLTEPLAVALHAVLAAGLSGEERVLVIGGGLIGLGTVWALAELGVRAPVVAVRHSQQADAASRLGAARAIRVRGGGEGPDLVRRVGGARPYPAMFGRTVWMGGFDVVFDAVGDAASFAESLESVRSGGRVIRVGETGLVGGPRPTPVWAPDVHIFYPFAYGREARGWEPDEAGAHTFELVLSRLSRREAELAQLVTHVFPLSRYEDAIRAAVQRRTSHAIKVALRPDGAADTGL